MDILKKIGCMAIAVFMLAASVACTNTNTDGTGTKPESNSETVTDKESGTDSESTTADEAVSDNNDEESTTDGTASDEMDYKTDIGDVDFGGKTVSVLVYDKLGVSDEFYATNSDTGDPVNDAVYRRNQMLIENLVIDLQIHLSSDVQTDTSIEAKTQAGAYHIFTNMTNCTIRSVFEGDAYDLSLFENINFDKKYWSQGFRDIASFGTGESQHLITGAPAITLYKYMYTTIFNKDEFAKHGWESLYDVVNRGDWTLEYQANLVKDSWADTDSNPEQSEDDFYGFVTGDTVSVDPYLVACGIHLIKKDSEGKWFWDATAQESVVNMVEAVKTLYYDSNGTYVFKSATYDDTGLTYIIDKFADGEAAMATIMFMGLESAIGKIPFDFGIVPMPKYNSDPNVGYRSYVQDQVTSIGIIKSVQEDDFERMGAFLEYLGQYSYELVIPEYYERTLSKKFMKDPTSKQMLNLISDSVEFDFVGAFSGILPVAVRDQLRLVVSGNGANVGSSFGSWGRTLSRNMDRAVNEKLENLQN